VIIRFIFTCVLEFGSSAKILKLFWVSPTRLHVRVVDVRYWVRSLKNKRVEHNSICLSLKLLHFAGINICWASRDFIAHQLGHSAGMEETCVQVPVPMRI